MVRHSRFSKSSLAAVLACCACSALAADDQEFFNYLADKYTQVERQVGASAMPTIQFSASNIQEAVAIAERTRAVGLKATGGDKTPSKYQQFRTLVFITFGMPERTLRTLFRQGAGRNDVGFVLRGMSSPDMYREMRRIRDLMSSEGESIVFVDPLLFKNYRVDRAPFTLHKAKDGRWYGLWGEIAIDGAREQIENGQGGRNRSPVGALYPIKEADMHEQMRKKFDAADWNKIANSAKGRASQTQIDVSLPPAPKDRVRLVDVSAKLPKDVIGPNGEVLATAGTIINPLEHVSLDERFAIFDPSSRYEIETVGLWVRQHPGLILIATHWDSSVQSKFNSQIFVLDPLMKHRFQIEHSPSLIEQDGLKIRVTELRARP